MAHHERNLSPWHCTLYWQYFGLIKFCGKRFAQSFIVATEAGILYEMKKRCPQKTFIPAPVEDETCACSECAFMKLNTIEKLYLCLKHEQPEVQLNILIEKANTYFKNAKINMDTNILLLEVVFSD